MSWLIDVNNVEENWILDVVNNQVVISLTVEQQSAIYAEQAEQSALLATEQADLATTAKDEAIDAKVIAETKASESATSATNALTSRNQAEGFKNDSETILGDIQALLPNFPKPSVFALNKRGIAESATFARKLKPVNNTVKALEALNPSLVLDPSVIKSGKLYSVIPDDGTGDFTVSRNGTATFLGADGLLKTALANEPRLEFNPDGTFKGVLVEAAATNFIRGSGMSGSVIGNIGSGGVLPNGWAVFVNAGLTIRVQEIGVLNGYSYINLKFSGTATSTILALFFNNFNTVAATLNQFWVGSIFVNRQNTAPNHRITLVGRNNGGGFIQSIATDITVPVNSSQRISLSGQVTNSNATFLNLGLSVDLITGQTYDFTTRLYAPQLEVGSVATSYIPTEASTVTRPADVILRTNVANLIGQTEGTLFVEMNLVQKNTFRRLITISSDNTTKDRLAVQITNLNRIALIFRANNAGIFETSTLQTLPNGINKILIKYKSGDIGIFLNGVKISSSTVSFTFSEEIRRVRLGVAEFGDVDFINDHIKSATLFKTALTDAQAIALTAL